MNNFHYFSLEALIKGLGKSGLTFDKLSQEEFIKTEDGWPFDDYIRSIDELEFGSDYCIDAYNNLMQEVKELAYKVEFDISDFIYEISQWDGIYVEDEDSVGLELYVWSGDPIGAGKRCLSKIMDHISYTISSPDFLQMWETNLSDKQCTFLCEHVDGLFFYLHMDTRKWMLMLEKDKSPDKIGLKANLSKKELLERIVLR